MKKQLFYILLISLGAQFIYPIPRGNYQNDCKNINYVDGKHLEATCPYLNQYGQLKWLTSGLLNVGPDQEVFNCNGRLSTDPCKI